MHLNLGLPCSLVLELQERTGGSEGRTDSYRLKEMAFCHSLCVLWNASSQTFCLSQRKQVLSALQREVLSAAVLRGPHGLVR